tara:strand:- start:320 stop:790 length:471 start_codon:yes stop_codon:yes gene_type:complete
MNKWYNGSGNTAMFVDIVADIKNHANVKGKVYVGTDSQVVRGECIFSTAICLHGANNQEGGRYYIRKVRFKANKFPSLLARISSEVEKSIAIALKILEDIPKVDIELHLDVSPSEKKSKSSRFADMLVGYARGVGFECKVKPDAFAATTIADKHTK